ncbi:cobalamin-binding protein [Oceanisphaera sp. DM8]|uniref:Cobalamin-binding protein n=2 Tax=Oceanisphaera pacifica TaxID=2818389 RepID=A0ABS3NIK9_9GAMM|nr:cobalamin-binding protein [Oceanisphaera pacifica]
MSTHHAERIISLAPHITEMLFAIGAGQQVVAVDKASDYPTQAKDLPKVANYRSLNMEQLLALEPDLVVVWGSAQQQMVQPLAQLGIPIFYSDPATFAKLNEELNQLGALTGHASQAAEVAARYQQQIDELTQAYQDASPVTVFYQIASTPLMSANASTWMGQAINLCGGINIMADSPAPYPQLSPEQVLAHNPQVIMAKSTEELAHWQQWPALRAVENQHLLTIDAQLMHRFTPRTPQGIRQLCSQLDKARSD